jgi:hypothetical protein
MIDSLPGWLGEHWIDVVIVLVLFDIAVNMKVTANNTKGIGEILQDHREIARALAAR